MFTLHGIGYNNIHMNIYAVNITQHPDQTGRVSCVVYPMTCGQCNHLSITPYLHHNHNSSVASSGKLETLSLAPG